MFSCEFCQISKNTFFTEHLWATASILLEGRRLKQIEISIISKIKKIIIIIIMIIKKMFLHFLFFTCCAHPLSFRASLFTRRPYVSLYSYFHSVQTCWIWKTYLNNTSKIKKNMLILKFHPGMNCLHVFFSFFHSGMKFHPCLSSRDEISSRKKRVNSRRHFTIDRDDFIPGRVRDEISRVNAL